MGRLTPLSRYTWSERVVAPPVSGSGSARSPYLARIASNSVVRPTVSLPPAYYYRTIVYNVYDTRVLFRYYDTRAVSTVDVATHRVHDVMAHA